MKARRIAGYLVLGALAAAAPPSAVPADTDLDWIGQLPGVAVFARKSTAGRSKVVYSVSASPEETFEKVRQGLSERGWTIETGKAASLAGISANKLTAKKAGSEVIVGLSQLGGVSHLSVEVTITVRGRCEDVVVNGSGNVITLEGDCEDLVVNGSGNEVRAESAIEDITTNGSSNTVTWSAARNPKGPDVRNNGTGNTIRRN
jgi:hypothetical protein